VRRALKARFHSRAFSPSGLCSWRWLNGGEGCIYRPLFYDAKLPRRERIASILLAMAELWRAIGRLLDTCPPAECANYLTHCGYGST
jgi:hypothetical protein